MDKRQISKTWCSCCDVEIVLPKKRTNLKRNRLPPPPTFAADVPVLPAHNNPSVSSQIINVEDWTPRQTTAGDGPSTVNGAVQEESEIIQLTDDDEVDKESADESTIHPQLVDVSSLVHLSNINEQRAHFLFPNYSQETIIAMQSFFTEPSATLVRPMARVEGLESSHVLDLVRKPRQWLNCRVMNSYFFLIELAMNRDVKCIKSYYLKDKIENNKWSMKIEIPLNEADPILFSRTALLIPFNFTRNHWTLITVFLKKRVICLYDSIDLCSNNISYTVQVVTEVFRYLCSEARRLGNTQFNPTGWCWTKVVSPVQRNHHDCGVFVCAFTWNMVYGKLQRFDQRDIRLIRQRMVFEFMIGKLVESSNNNMPFDAFFIYNLLSKSHRFLAISQ